MFRACTVVQQQAAAAAAATTSSAPPAQLTKAQILHKIIIGEMAFKNKLPLKQCNIEQSFGKNWQSELAEHMKSQDKAAQDLVARQIRRLSLTRYTSRELAEYLPIGGVPRVDASAKQCQVKQGVAFLQAKGEQEFRDMVKSEAKLANWTAAEASQFIDAVIKASK